jgi:hypothetical protein
VDYGPAYRRRAPRANLALASSGSEQHILGADMINPIIAANTGAADDAADVGIADHADAR